MLTNNKINSESNKINLFGIITLIDEQICYEILRTIYYSQYNIYKENFSPYDNIGTDAKQYSGDISDKKNALFENIISEPKYLQKGNMIQAVQGGSIAITEPILNIKNVTAKLSTFNINTLYARYIYNYIVDTYKDIQDKFNRLDLINQDLLKPNDKINLTITAGSYQKLANYISNVVYNTNLDIDFPAELQKQLLNIITNQQKFLYAEKNKRIMLGSRILLVNNSNIYIVMTPHIIYGYFLDLFIRKRKTIVIVKKILDDLDLPYDESDIASFYKIYDEQNFLYINDPKNISQENSQQNSQQNSQKDLGDSIFKNKLLWVASSTILIIICILIIILIKFL